jgi:hypothetical protein
LSRQNRILERVPDSSDKQWTPVWESYENGNEISYSTQCEYHSFQNIKFQGGSYLISYTCLISENRQFQIRPDGQTIHMRARGIG